MSTAPVRSKIVVGIDGSPHSAMAMAWALDEARLRKLPLRVIHAFPALVSYTGATAHEYYPQVQKEAEETFERAMQAMPQNPDVEIERSLMPGHPAQVLVDASRGAGLLVVGSRGFGGFRGLRLGSVSVHCVNHAHCPVLVIRETD